MKTFMEFWGLLLLDVESFDTGKWSGLKQDAVVVIKIFLTEIKDDE